jgi:preprotein translocase subunit YajC
MKNEYRPGDMVELGLGMVGRVTHVLGDKLQIECGGMFTEREYWRVSRIAPPTPAPTDSGFFMKEGKG